MFNRKKKIPNNRISLFFILILVIAIITTCFLSFQYQKNHTINQYKNTYEKISTKIWEIADQNNNLAQNDIISLNKAKKEVKDVINKTIKHSRAGEDFWLMDNNSFMMLHPDIKLEHRKLYDFQNNKGIFVFKTIIDSLQKNKFLFLKQKMPSRRDKNKFKTKYIYATNYEPWNWILGIEINNQLIKSDIWQSKLSYIILSSFVFLLLIIYLIFFYKGSESEEKEQQINEQKYKALFNAANDGILLIEKYRFIDCNYKTLEIFNATKDQLIGQSPDQLSPKQQPDGSNSYDLSIDIIDKCLEGQRQYFEWTHKRINGETFFAEVSVNKIEIEHRELLLAVVRDITARKNLEKRLVEAKNRAEESDRLKSAFLANTSHEIRTPMNAIVGFSKLLQKNNINTDKKKEYTKNIIEKGDQLLQIINDIIDVSKIEANQLNINQLRFSLNGLMEEIYSDFEELSEKNSEIDFKLHQEVKNNGTFIHLDKIRLKQVISNLLSNAFKYTDKGTIEYGYKLEDKDTILFYVKDTGIGIDQKKQEYIFDSFRKTDDSSKRLYGGTGLGLSISKALIELMGGKIWVESDLNEGATFYFTLPYNPAHKIKEEKTMETEPEIFNWEDKTILIVEDDILSYEYLKELLRETNAGIIHAKDGQTAIEKCKDNSDIDLVLMDIQLPGVDGNTATKEIRKFNKDLPILAQTAYALEEEKNKILESGCNDYISKPINEKQLYKKINMLLTQ